MENCKNYCVYLHVNKFNGKIYIGITSRKPEIRWRSGKGYSEDTYFGRAIKKYGWDNFGHYILEYDLSKEEAGEKEKYYIQYFNSLAPNGYNSQPGGFIDNIGDKTRKACIKTKSHSIICIETQQVYYSISEAGRQLGVSGTTINEAVNHPHLKACGYHWMRYEDYLENGYTKTFNPHYRQVICLETKEIYNSVYAASKEIGKTYNTIASCCKNKIKSAHGYHWMYLDDFLKLKEEPVLGKVHVKKKILCVEKGKVFDSLRKAGEWAKISSGTISKVVDKPTRTAGGFHWQSVE